MLVQRDTRVLRFPCGFRKTQMTPEILREMADLLEQSLAEGYIVTENVDKWNDQDGMNYPETLTLSGVGEGYYFEIHMGRFAHIKTEEVDELED